jgi:hypothetical protein
MPLAKEMHASLSHLLWGAISISKWKYQMDFGTIAARKWLIKKWYKLPDGAFSPHGFLLTWADYLKFIEKSPQERYKVYLSLDLSTDIKKQKAESFWLELIKKVKEQNLSLTMKTFEHNYDSCNLYTWDIKALTEILKELYAKYQKDWIFLEVYHFLQKPIPWINPNHIWIVQEPGNSNRSHSVRMSDLGGYLDEWKAYVDACKLAWVKPDAPREIDSEFSKSK